MTNQPTEAAVRESIVLACRRLWERGLLGGQDGNVSARLDDEWLLVTPAGFSKIDVAVDDLVVLKLDGTKVSGNHGASSEIAVHLRAYQRRPDIGAVVHAHPPHATALTLVGETIPEGALAETALLGRIPLVPYAMPGTRELAERFDPFWDGHQAFLMANHGALTLGTNVRVAHQRMETVEHAAQIVVAARALGPLRELSATELATLRASRAKPEFE